MANEVVCIIGLGYVGLPLAVAFANEKIEVTGFDVNKRRIEELKRNYDRTNEVDEKQLKRVRINFSYNENEIKKADFIIMCLPTPINDKKEPDMSALKAASATVGKNLKKNAIVIVESTVYPGVTEEILVPIIEKNSNLKCGVEFKIAYSPERINPGDKEHTIDKVTKVVSAIDNESLEKVSDLYKKIAKAGIFKAKNIKTAEAAKVIENIQRDLNIALMNELAMLFEKMDINTKDVVEAAATKWNFHKYTPGLVGGHCIPTDPYYLVHKAKELNFKTHVILAGRDVNNQMPSYVAGITIKALNEVNKETSKCKILILGLTFKENVKDVRTSPADELIKALKKNKAQVVGYDPIIDENEKKLFKIKMLDEFDSKKMDAIIIMSPHRQFAGLSFDKIKREMNSKPIIIDIKGFFEKMHLASKGFIYKKL